MAAHVDPDGDAVGSVLGLALAFRAAGREAAVWPMDRPPVRYAFLPSYDELTGPPPVLRAGDTVVALDAASDARLPDAVGGFLRDGGIVINIDHHVSNAGFGSWDWVDAGAPATAAMVWDLLEEMAIPVGADAATCLYAGLVSDTGTFTYGNTGERAFRVAAALAAQGADPSRIAKQLASGYRLAYIRALGGALARMRREDDGVVYTFLFADELRQCLAAGGEPEGVVDYTRRVEGCRVGLLFLEQGDGLVRVSLRAQGECDVQKIAAAYGGGGHAAAAGCVVAGELPLVVSEVVKAVGTCLNSQRRE